MRRSLLWPGLPLTGLGLIGAMYWQLLPHEAPHHVPAALPAPVAAPALPRFSVPFEWDRSDLTPEARAVIAEAARVALRQPGARVVVGAHTDSSGEAAYNLRLSQRMAEAVAAELVRNGLSRRDMVLEAHGETRLLLATGDNVREPRNRRVEIEVR